MYVDHKVELKDGGAPLDRRNVWLLCGSCHTLKTVAREGEAHCRAAWGAVGVNGVRGDQTAPGLTQREFSRPP